MPWEVTVKEIDAKITALVPHRTSPPPQPPPPSPARFRVPLYSPDSAYFELGKERKNQDYERRRRIGDQLYIVVTIASFDGSLPKPPLPKQMNPTDKEPEKNDMYVYE